MDVLRPPIVCIQGRCYRKNPIERKDVDDYDEEEEEEYSTQMAEDDMYADEVCDAFTNIEETDNGYRLAMDIPSAYFKYIIGRKAETKRRLENETRTQINIPRQGHEGNIIINGRDRRGVMSVKTRIDVLVESARQRQPFTHFLSFPVNSANIKDRFMEFKEDVLRFCDGDRGIDGSIFQNPSKLHLTVGTLVLMNDAEIEKAIQILNQCTDDLVRPILRDSPLMCQCRGLEYMNDDPGAVDVLYAKVTPQDDSDRLQMLSDRLVEKFTLAGLMHKDYDRVKLHVTAMNTLFRKDPTGTQQPTGDRRAQTRESFDASNVLKLYGDYDFGLHHISEVHLSQRYSTSPSGYYACADLIPL